MVHDIRFWIVAGAGVLAAFVAVNVGIAGQRALAAPAYWRNRMSQPVAPNAIRLVALGDSSVEAIGATHPSDGYVGRIATYVQEKTGRPVHVANVSSGGSVTDILAAQLPRVDVKTADLVIVADDNFDGVSPEQYRRELEALIAALPVDRTVISELPRLPGEAPYQLVLRQVTEAHGVMRADFGAVFNGPGRRLDIFSWLPPHLNSKGYGYWFQAFKPGVDKILARIEGR